jgi:16S rRNA (cytosine967-C5)-methyltransferase
LTHGSVSPARRVAFATLVRTAAGAFASDLLDSLSRDLDSRDAGLASEIVFGCLRRQAQLDFLISLRNPTLKATPEVRTALRMGVYQLCFLDRVPAHAAVSESVELVRRAGQPSAAGLVNAILRRTRRPVQPYPTRDTALSCPAWLLDRWTAHYGAPTATAIAEAFLQTPVTSVASTGRIQDLGSQSLVPLLDIEPGQTFLDLCAAPGNKTAQALERGAYAIACDINPRRLAALAGMPCARLAADATVPLPLAARFDRILVDAPCSGTGTLDRNPEIKWRLTPAELPALQFRQRAILANAIPLLKPGGRLLYSTCSLEPEENEQVIASFPGPWRTSLRLPGRDPGDGFFAALLDG